MTLNHVSNAFPQQEGPDQELIAVFRMLSLLEENGANCLPLPKIQRGEVNKEICSESSYAN